MASSGFAAGLIVLALVAVVFTLVGAGILMFACRMLGLPVPKFIRACFVSLLSVVAWIVISTAVQMVMMFAVYAALETGGEDVESSANTFMLFQVFAFVVPLVFWAIASCAIYKFFVPLPTYKQAIAVWGITFLVWFAISVVMYVVLYAYLVAGGAGV